MSAPRPSSYAGWASGPSGYASATSPVPSDQAVGFSSGQAPPAGYHNWLFSLGYGWQAYTDAALLRRTYVVHDDFTGQAVDIGKWIVTGSGATIQQPLTVSGIAGECAFYAASGAARGDLELGAPGAPIATGHFRYEARMRMLSSGFSGGIVKFGALLWQNAFNQAGWAAFSTTGGTGNWMLIYGTGTQPTAIDLGLKPATGHQTFMLERANGILTAAIGPTLVATVPLSIVVDSGSPFVQVISSGQSMGAAFDSVVFVADTHR